MGRRTIEEVRAEVEKCIMSGLSKREYCRRHGMNINSLQWMFARLRNHEEKGAVIRTGFSRLEFIQPEETSSIMVHYGPVRIELNDNFSEQVFGKIIQALHNSNV